MPHKARVFGGRLSGVVAAYSLVLIVVLAQPVASVAWLGGVHATSSRPPSTKRLSSMGITIITAHLNTMITTLVAVLARRMSRSPGPRSGRSIPLLLSIQDLL